MKNYTVEPITYNEARPWITKKHYAKRMPPISHVFGLFKDKQLYGVCSFGNNGGNPEGNFIGKYQVIELNRLCVEDKTKNCASFLVSQCLKQLPQEYIVVSYADIDQEHIGYIYQATNWLYTGISKGDVSLLRDGKKIHRKSFYDVHGTSTYDYIRSKGYEIIKQKGKHRYFYLLGTKKIKKDKQKILKYPILPYPKGESKRYDATAEFHKQTRLF